MRVFRFERHSGEDVILVSALIEGKFLLRLALDTAATHTTIDSNVLYLSGYQLEEKQQEQQVETANGVIFVESYSIRSLSAIGIEQTAFPVQVYDFLSHGISSDYDGVIGLDFLIDHRICIDLAAGEISVAESSHSQDKI